MKIKSTLRKKRTAEIAEMRGRGLTVKHIAKLMGLSLGAIYNYIVEIKGSKKMPESYDAMWDCMEARGMCDGCVLVTECRERWDNA